MADGARPARSAEADRCGRPLAGRHDQGGGPGLPIPDDTVGIAHLDRGWGRPEFPSRPTVAVTKGPFRFILQLAPDATVNQRVETLYDASGDPAERENVLEEKPEVASELRAVADAYLKQSPPDWAGTPRSVELDEKEAAELRALGYAVP